MVVDVIVDILASETDRIFEYYAGQEHRFRRDRVTVPFGGHDEGRRRHAASRKNPISTPRR